MTKSEIQLIRSLDDKRGRAEAGLFVAEGEKLVREILASGFRVRKVYYTERPTTPSGYACHPSFRKEGNSPHAEVVGCSAEQISAKDMERASRLKTPTDSLALVEIPQRTLDPAALRGRLTLALDEVQNPGNMGTIIRLADWFGITDILCSEGTADCFNPKVVQATMGAITRVAVHYGNLAQMIEAAGLPVYGTFLEGGNIYDTDLTPEGIIVLGSEGRGISAGVERLLTRKLFIPPYPSDNQASESLNVAIAAAIVCSEFRRR